MLEQNKILKRYPVEELAPGMVVGRSVYDENEKELIAEGAVLTNALILSILDRPIFSVMIRVDRPPAAVRDTHVLDSRFVNQYDQILARLRDLFSLARQTKAVDIVSFQKIADDCYMEFTDGLKAITQVHNILRKDDYLLYHSINVAILAGVLGRWMNLGREEIRDLVLAGLLHDIGKTQVPEEILDKPGKLTDAELYAAQRHVTKGVELLRGTVLREKKNILFGVLQHHERLDRSGYPEGLLGDGIYPFAKILAIVDVYDAMAANKVYARKKNPFEIFEELFKEMVSRLDTQLCVLFIKNVRRSMNGNWVRLSSGEKAKIVYLDESQIKALPMVQTENGEFADLNDSKGLTMVEILSNDEVIATK